MPGRGPFIRGVPSHVRSWIEAERQQHRMGLKEFVVHTLQRAADSPAEPALFDGLSARPAVSPDAVPFTFMDLFAGVGGLRTALQRVGGTCVFSSEWDRNAQKTYTRWFGETPEGDIAKITPKDVRDPVEAIWVPFHATISFA